MSIITLEIAILLLLIAANGVFATAEMAFVAAKKARLRKLAEAGDASAKVAMQMFESPTRFFSTVQVGITLIGIVAGVFGGTTLARELAEVLREMPWLAPYAHGVSLTVVICVITFLSLVVGELVPKRLALNDPERITLLLARPMHRLSMCVSPLITLLSATTDLVLKCLGFRKGVEPSITNEEIKTLIEQGHHAGVFHQAEIEMVEGVMKLDEQTVADLMTPRARIIWLNADDADEVNWRRIVASSHTYFPVREKRPDKVLGLVSVKAMWANLAVGAPSRLRDLVTPPLIVPGTMSATQLLETFKQHGKHLALVGDEFGQIEGLVTLIDVMEAIVGSLPADGPRHQKLCRQRSDGSWLVDATMDFNDLLRVLHIENLSQGDAAAYRSVGGFVLSHLSRIPDEGDHFEWGDFSFEVVDMDRHRIDKLAVARITPSIVAGESAVEETS